MEGVGLVVKLLTGRPDVQITGRTVYGLINGKTLDLDWATACSCTREVGPEGV